MITVSCVHDESKLTRNTSNRSKIIWLSQGKHNLDLSRTTKRHTFPKDIATQAETLGVVSITTGQRFMLWFMLLNLYICCLVLFISLHHPFFPFSSDNCIACPFIFKHFFYAYWLWIGMLLNISRTFGILFLRKPKALFYILYSLLISIYGNCDVKIWHLMWIMLHDKCYVTASYKLIVLSINLA